VFNDLSAVVLVVVVPISGPQISMIEGVPNKWHAAERASQLRRYSYICVRARDACVTVADGDMILW